MSQKILTEAKKLKFYRWGAWSFLFFAMVANGITLFVLNELMKVHIETLMTVVGEFKDYPKPLRQMFLVSNKFSPYFASGVIVSMIFGFVTGLFAFFMLYLENSKKLGN